MKIARFIGLVPAEGLRAFLACSARYAWAIRICVSGRVAPFAGKHSNTGWLHVRWPGINGRVTFLMLLRRRLGASIGFSSPSEVCFSPLFPLVDRMGSIPDLLRGLATSVSCAVA